MTIAFIGAFTGIGGIQRVAAQVASELAGWHTMLYIDYRGDDTFHFPLDNKVAVFETASSKNKGRRMALDDKVNIMYQEEIAAITDILSQRHVDVAVFCGSFCTAIIAEIKNRLPKIKTIAWQHNSFEQYMGKYTEKYRAEYLEGVHRADAVVSLTNDDAAWFSEFNGNSVCIYNPIAVRHSMRCDIMSNRFVFVGRIAIEQKGLDLLLAAFELLDDNLWTLHIVGGGEDNALSDMVSASEKRNLISLKGYKEGDDLSAEYAGGAVFVLPSRWEGFGLAIAEAMSFGLPIISTPTVGGKEVLAQGRCGLVTKSFASEDIAEAMRTMTNNIDELRRYTALSLQRVDDFSLQKIMPLWEKTLANL